MGGEFQEQKELFDSVFDEKICTVPEELEAMHAEMASLHEKMQIAWDLKQEQLTEIKDILYHINYIDTGLSHNKKPTGDDLVDSSCEDIAAYVEKANKTAWEEKEDLIENQEEIEDWTLDWTPIHAHVCGENGESGQVAQQLAQLAQQSGRGQLQKLLSTMELSVQEIVLMRQFAMKMSAVLSTVFGENGRNGRLAHQDANLKRNSGPEEY